MLYILITKSYLYTDFEILFFNQRFIDAFLDFIWSLNFWIYKFLINVLMNLLYYVTRFIFLNYLNFIFTVLSNKLLLKIVNFKNLIRDALVHYNTFYIKWRKRYALYYRFGIYNNIRLLFFITYFIILVYIWRNRNLYRNNFPFYYYCLHLGLFMVLSIFINFFIANWFICEILGLFISFIYIMLTLK